MFEKAPLTSDSTIIFPLNQKEKRFSRSVYSEAMTQGRVSSADINYALCFFEIITSRVTSQPDLKSSFILRYLIPFAILMFFKVTDQIQISSVWFWFWLYCIFGVLIQLSSRNTQIKKAKADLEGVIQMIQPAYLKKGLKWRVPQDPSVWIELVREYRQVGEPLIPVVHKEDHQESTEKISEVVIEEQYKPLSEEVSQNEAESTDYTLITGPVVSYGFAEK
jgi:hypothetical protein